MVRKRKKATNKKKNGKKDVKKLTVQQTIAYKEMGRGWYLQGAGKYLFQMYPVL